MKARQWSIIIIWIVAMILSCCALLSCSFMKKINRSKSDSASIRKELNSSFDSSKSGSVKNEKNHFKEDSDWWKITQTFPQSKSPVPGVTNVYPSTVVYEGGKNSKEQEQSSSDSSWMKNAISKLESKLDSAGKVIENYESNTKTKAFQLTWWMVIILCGLVYIAIKLGESIMKKYSFNIVKK